MKVPEIEKSFPLNLKKSEGSLGKKSIEKTVAEIDASCTNVLESSSTYTEPELLDPILKQIERGKEIRAKNLQEKVCYKEALEQLDSILDKDGRVTFGIGEQLSVADKMAVLEKDYGIKIEYKENDKRPYISGENEQQNFTKILANYSSYFEKNKIDEVDEAQADRVIKFFTENQTKKISELKRKLHQQEEYSDIKWIIKGIIGSEASYKAVQTEIKNQGKFDSAKEALSRSIKDVDQKFEEVVNNIGHELDKNQALTKKKASYDQLVFSVNPFDIAMMSTQKKWSSCMEVGDIFFSRVSDEIGAFSIIVYGTKNGDLTDPANRVLLKPYLSEDKSSIVWRGERVYGDGNAELLDHIDGILAEKFLVNEKPQRYTLDESIYADGYATLDFSRLSVEEIIKNSKKIDLKSWNRIIRKFPDEKGLQRVAVKQNWRALKWIPEDRRTPEMEMAAVTSNGMALEFIPEDRRTPEMERAAVKQDWRALEFIPKDRRTPEMEM